MVTVKGTLGAMALAAALTAASGHGVSWCVTMAAMIPAGMVLALILVRLMP